jgi:hypothetical protein
VTIGAEPPEGDDPEQARASSAAEVTDRTELERIEAVPQLKEERDE